VSLAVHRQFAVTSRRVPPQGGAAVGCLALGFVWGAGVVDRIGRSPTSAIPLGVRRDPVGLCWAPTWSNRRSAAVRSETTHRTGSKDQVRRVDCVFSFAGSQRVSIEATLHPSRVSQETRRKRGRAWTGSPVVAQTGLRWLPAARQGVYRMSIASLASDPSQGGSRSRPLVNVGKAAR